MRYLALVLAGTSFCSLASAQLVVETTFNPATAGGLCGVAFSTDIWVYDCFAATIDRYDSAGQFVAQLPYPGSPANDVDLDIVFEDFMLGTTLVPAGSLLVFDGESGPVEAYAIDRTTGALLAMLTINFGNSHVVGGSYHATRNTLFLVEDNIEQIAEVDPVTGNVLNTFSTTGAGFSIGYGDIDASRGNGNLFVVSSDHLSIAEFTPAGTLLTTYALPAGVSGLSGIALDDSTGKAWVASNNGNVWLLAGLVTIGNPYCGPAVPNSTGLAAEMRVIGSPFVVDNAVVLEATELPPNQFGYFLTSLTHGSVIPPGSQGALCLGGAIGRYNAAVLSSGAGGGFTMSIDLTATPTPTGPVSVVAGQTRNFQCWYRDLNPGATSNFTNAFEVAFE